MPSTPVTAFDPPDLPLVATMRRLLQVWATQWHQAALGLACAFAQTLLSLVIATTIQRTIDDVVVPHRTDRLTPYVAVLVGLGVLRVVVAFVRRYSTARVGIAVEARMRALLYDAYLRFPRAFYDRHATGQVVSRATNDIFPIRYFMGWGLVQSAQSLMMIVGVGVVLVAIDPMLALCAGLPMPLVGFLTWRFARRVVPISREVQQRKADVTEAADESVVGIEMVQAFGRAGDVRARFDTRAEAVRDTTLLEAGVEARFLPALVFLPTLGVAAVLLVGGRAVIGGDLTIGEFVLFNTLLLQLVWPFEALGWILGLAQRAVAAAGRSFAWIDHVPSLPQAAETTPVPAGPLGVRFDGVRFAYGGSEVLRGIDLSVEAGEVVAVCGATGAGKTTLLNLLPRFYDATGGRVLLGEVDVTEVAPSELRRAVAVVTQRPILFSTTLWQNVTAARPDAARDEVLAACAAAGVAAFVDDLPDGYETAIGERGVNLSGGQRQRVALARALLADARVVVLDDPLSAVDTQTERRLLDNLRPAVAGRTVLVATQRLSTVEIADRAVVIEDGRIVESGRPTDLLEADGAFAALFGDEVAVA